MRQISLALVIGLALGLLWPDADATPVPSALQELQLDTAALALWDLVSLKGNRKRFVAAGWTEKELANLKRRAELSHGPNGVNKEWIAKWRARFD